MGRIYEVSLSDGLRGHDIHTKFHKNRFRYSKVVRGDTQRHKTRLKYSSNIKVIVSTI
jgi:hypothetical protein